ncbi:HipA N-terminal domain-containing protein [Persicobacter psychrovividus]|uniref:HipA N-terminal subdomain 1 domain-containing protein n=1 Tax=Persicobacter psychrovividus TaxID=387638 RepID=A0ABN6LFX6_9BACT|nr:hypothetical protein PEPS_42650 [Persicobacter psychrovividus]
MNRSAKVLYHKTEVGLLSETDDGYLFQYHEAYCESNTWGPISLSLPVQKAPYHAKTLFPFFDGLIPEELADVLAYAFYWLRKMTLTLSKLCSIRLTKTIKNIPLIKLKERLKSIMNYDRISCDKEAIFNRCLRCEH